MKKWIATLFYFVVIITVWIYKEPLLMWMEEGDQSHIPLMLLIATFLAIFPVVPFGIIAGIMGSKYGLLIGGVVNITASTLAAVGMFIGVRYFFSEEGRAYLSRSHKVDKFTEMVENHSFMAILFARLIPILPAPVVNIYCAISKIPIHSYFFATILGKIPVMLVFAFVGDNIFDDPINLLYVFLIYSLFLLFVFIGYHKRNSSFLKSKGP